MRERAKKGDLGIQVCADEFRCRVRGRERNRSDWFLSSDFGKRSLDEITLKINESRNVRDNSRLPSQSFCCLDLCCVLLGHINDDLFHIRPNSLCSLCHRLVQVRWASLEFRSGSCFASRYSSCSSLERPFVFRVLSSVQLGGFDVLFFLFFVVCLGGGSTPPGSNAKNVNASQISTIPNQKLTQRTS